MYSGKNYAIINNNLLLLLVHSFLNMVILATSANAFKRLAIEIKAAENLNNNFSRLYMMMFRSKGIQPLT